MKINITADDGKVFARLQAGLTLELIDPVIERVALRTHRQIVQATPKKWFGQVRRSWQVEKPGVAMRVVYNANKIMFWLEHGTQAHGPKTKKALFIPLTKKAVGVTAGAFTTGSVDVSRDPNWTGENRRAIKFQRTNAKGQTKTQTLIYGVDYVLAKRVKGIRAMKIVERQRITTAKMLFDEMKRYVAGLIRG